MNRWKGSKSWALLGIAFLLIGGIILYSGYIGTLSSSTQERVRMMTNETEQLVTASTVREPEAGSGSEALMTQKQTAEMTVDDQGSLSISSNIAQGISKEKNLKNFPSPAQGNPRRSVGNYYSKVFANYLFHAGVDYAEPEGTIIRATQGGKVIFAGADPILGQKVILDCGEGWLVTYGGLDNLRVEVGKMVETKDALGQISFFAAAESDSGQPQLHYEVWHKDEVQSPL